MTTRNRYIPAPLEVIAQGRDAHLEWLSEHQETRPDEKVNCPAVTMERSADQSDMYWTGWDHGVEESKPGHFRQSLAFMSLLGFYGRMGGPYFFGRCSWMLLTGRDSWRRRRRCILNANHDGTHLTAPQQDDS